MSIEIRREGANIGALFDQIRYGMPGALAKLVLQGAQVAAGAISKEVYSSFDVRTGALARSFRATFLGNVDGAITATASSDLIYARVQDEGGEVKPRVMRTLAVPIRSANIAVGKWPRHWPKGELRFIRRPGKDPLLATVTGKGKNQKVHPKYVLKESVHIVGQNYVQKAADTSQDEIAEILGGGVEQIVDRAGKTASGRT